MFHIEINIVNSSEVYTIIDSKLNCQPGGGDIGLGNFIIVFSRDNLENSNTSGEIPSIVSISLRFEFKMSQVPIKAYRIPCHKTQRIVNLDHHQDNF